MTCDPATKAYLDIYSSLQLILLGFQRRFIFLAYPLNTLSQWAQHPHSEHEYSILGTFPSSHSKLH